MGLASWYTAPYKGRKAANGQVFSDRAMTAAHRTLPMGSLVRDRLLASIARGEADLDFAALSRRAREDAGLKQPAEPARKTAKPAPKPPSPMAKRSA